MTPMTSMTPNQAPTDPRWLQAPENWREARLLMDASVMKLATNVQACNFLELLNTHKVGEPGEMPADFPSECGETLLHLLVSINNPEALPMARALIDLGADVDRHGMNGATPLITAVIARSQGMLRLLLEAGADPNALATGARVAGSSALDHFLRLMPASSDAQILEDLILFGCTLKSNPQGLTPLDRAVSLNSADRVRILLQHGANPLAPLNIKTDSGMVTETPIETARAAGFHAVADIMQAWVDARAAGEAIDSMFKPEKIRVFPRTAP